MQTVTSADGTPIAYESSGAGPAVILIGGAFGSMASASGMASALAPRFTAIAYDRRGRGGSGDTQPYDIEREVEDLAALIREAGGSAFVYGHSSGAVLALEAVVRGLQIPKLALYEPPFIVDDARSPMPADFDVTLRELVAQGRRGDAVAAFWREALQMPPEAIADARRAPMWPGLEALAHTVAYDTAIVAPYALGRPLPAEWSTAVTVPVLVLDGGASPAFQRNSVAALVRLLPHAERRTLQGQGHGAPAELLAPLLIEFFNR